MVVKLLLAAAPRSAQGIQADAAVSQPLAYDFFRFLRGPVTGPREPADGFAADSLEIEKHKLEIERQKLEFEREKFEFEKQKQQKQQQPGADAP